MAPNLDPESQAGRFALRVKEAREASGKTQQEFADLVGVSRSFLSDVENLRSKPGLELLLGMGTAPIPHNDSFGEKFSYFSKDWLLTGEGHIWERGLSGEWFQIMGKNTGLDFDLLRLAFALVGNIEAAAGYKLRGRKLQSAVKMLYEHMVREMGITKINGQQISGPKPGETVEEAMQRVGRDYARSVAAVISREPDDSEAV